MVRVEFPSLKNRRNQRKRYNYCFSSLVMGFLQLLNSYNRKITTATRADVASVRNDPIRLRVKWRKSSTGQCGDAFRYSSAINQIKLYLLGHLIVSSYSSSSEQLTKLLIISSRTLLIRWLRPCYADKCIWPPGNSANASQTSVQSDKCENCLPTVLRSI